MMNLKNYLKKLTLLLTVFFMSCQTESSVEIHSAQETITSTSPLTTYIQRVVMQKTTQDNIIDKTNCFMIKFPYTVTVNYIQLNINSASDYVVVQNNINANSYDSDIVTIQFPITVILNDYSEKSLANQTAFNNLITECQSSSNNFGKINCLTINYPITISIYNSNSQIASTTTVSSNQSLYNFIETLEDNKYVAIGFPISIANSSGQNIIVTSNNQFEDIIKSAIDNCAENPSPSLDFIQTLTTGSWKIAYYYHDSEKTSTYTGYSFVFNSNKTFVATKSGINYNGTWSTKIDNGVREFEIKIETNPLHELDEDWEVLEFNATQLRFRHVDGVLETEYLYFEKI